LFFTHYLISSLFIAPFRGVNYTDTKLGVSGFSPAAGLKNGQSNRERN